MKRLMIGMFALLGLVLASCETNEEVQIYGSGNGYCPVHGYDMTVGVAPGTDFGSMEFYKSPAGYVFPLNIPGSDQDYVVFIETNYYYPDTNPDHITMGPGSIKLLPKSEWGSKVEGRGCLIDGVYTWYEPNHKIRRDKVFKITLFDKADWEGSITVEGEVN